MSHLGTSFSMETANGGQTPNLFSPLCAGFTLMLTYTGEGLE